MDVTDHILVQGTDHTPWRLFAPHEPSQDYAVLWLQGWTSSMDLHREGVKRMAEQTGIVFATLDYAGHGTHPLPLEESTKRQQHEEVVGLFDELANRGYKNIITIGGSFGAYMTALLTGVRPVHTAVLRAPAMYDDNEFELPYRQTKRWQDVEEYNRAKAHAPYIHDNLAVSAIRRFDGFTYILEHELDEQVPRIMPQTYFSAAKHGNYIIIPKTKHSPKLMPNPTVHFAYIEHFVVAIVEASKLRDKLNTIRT